MIRKIKSSTQQFGVMDIQLVLQDTEEGTPPNYARSSSIQSRELSRLFKEKYGHEAFIVPSGTFSIFAGLFSALSALNRGSNPPQINFIMGDETYSGTPKTIKKLRNIYKFKILKFSCSDDQSILDVISSVQKGVNLLYFESCSNPFSSVFNYEVIKKFKKVSRRSIVVCDNTWLSHVIFNPFDWGADVVISSTTKYYSGGKCIGGVVMSNNMYSLSDKIFQCISAFGSHVSPLNCVITSQEFTTVAERISRSSELTVKIAGWMHEQGIKYSHSSLGQNLEKAEKYFKKDKNGKILHPSVINFEIPLSLEAAIDWIRSTGIKVETSFGDSHSKICSFIKSKNENTTYCRLSIGSDDSYENLISKLSMPFEKKK